MLSPMSWLIIILSILGVAMIIIVILFITKAPPFNKPYKFLDPRTWKPVESNTAWLTPDFDYGPYAVSIPTAEIRSIYDNLLISLGSEPIKW